MVTDVDEKDDSRGIVVLSSMAVQGRVSSGSPLPLGRTVRVKLVEADVAKRTVAFEQVEEHSQTY